MGLPLFIYLVTVLYNGASHDKYVTYLCLVVCSIPPLSVVGLSEEQAIEQAKGDILVFTSTFNPMKNTVSGYVSHYEVLL